jgi:hypothetical protein
MKQYNYLLNKLRSNNSRLAQLSLSLAQLSPSLLTFKVIASHERNFILVSFLLVAKE